jgi:hypothetical protein
MTHHKTGTREEWPAARRQRFWVLTFRVGRHTWRLLFSNVFKTFDRLALSADAASF